MWEQLQIIDEETAVPVFVKRNAEGHIIALVATIGNQPQSTWKDANGLTYSAGLGSIDESMDEIDKKQSA